MYPERFMAAEERVSGSPRPARPVIPLADPMEAPTGPRFVETADPSWHLKVLRTLARDYPEISDKVWSTAISENAAELVERARARDAAGS